MSLSPLYVVTSIFNPRRFRSRINLYKQFYNYLTKSGVRLVTVELAFGNRPFEINKDASFHLGLRTTDELWHKERALNLGIQHLTKLVPDWEYVAWLDADIEFARPDWAEEAIHLLQHYSVIQLFGQAVSLDPNHEIVFTCPSVIKNFDQYGYIEWGDNPGLIDKEFYQPARRGHPGLGWAFRRSVLDKLGGLLDICINGSGDLHMTGCFTGHSLLAVDPRCSQGYKDRIINYGHRCDKYLKQNVGYMPGIVNHYWHGKSKDRGYEDRWKLLVKYQFDPDTDLITGVNGLYQWAGNKKHLEYETRKSLSKRNEDSIDN